jgi:hypothetical protein
LAGELPVLLDRELAVRVEHGAAKSWDLAPFRLEMDRFPELHAASLTPRERVLMQVMGTLRRLGLFRLTSAASRAYRRVRPASA